MKTYILIAGLFLASCGRAEKHPEGAVFFIANKANQKIYICNKDGSFCLSPIDEKNHLGKGVYKINLWQGQYYITDSKINKKDTESFEILPKKAIYIGKVKFNNLKPEDHFISPKEVNLEEENEAMKLIAEDLKCKNLLECEKFENYERSRFRIQ